MEKGKKDQSKETFDINIIRNLAITKQLNFLIGSGASMPAIPLMSSVEGETDEEKNKNLIKKVTEISNKILNEDFSDSDIKTTYDHYYEFMFQVIQLLNKSNSRQVPRSVNIFTTNYDLFIEKIIDELATQNRIVFNDGTSGYFKKYIDSTNYNRVVSYKGLNDNYINEIPSINLIKPHGSVNWKKVSEERILVGSNVVDNPVVVKPTGIEGEETFLNNYFHDMLRMFQLELDKPQSVLFVLGFSFQDAHIAKMLKRALQNAELMVFIFAFKDDNVSDIMNNLDLNQLPNNLKILSPKDFQENMLIKHETDDETWYSFDIGSLTRVFKGDLDEW